MRINFQSAAEPKAAARGRLSERAFTLVETMVGGGLLVFVAVFLYGAFSNGYALLRLAQENVRADQILVETMETVRVYDWSKVTGPYMPTSFTNYYYSNGGTVSGAIYTGSITVSPAPLTESYSNTLRQVTVTLNWNSGTASHNRSMTTLVSQNGIQTYFP